MLERELGEVGISVPTSASFETLMEYSDELTVDSIWINLKTLVRNIHSALEDKDNVDTDEIAETLIDEIRLMTSILGNIAIVDPIRLIIYENTYKGLEKRLPHAKIKLPRTEKQLNYQSYESKVISKLKHEIEWIEDIDNLEFREGDYIIEGEDANALMITHLPIDLLSYYNFKELKLLESHTGKIKPKPMWNTKLTGGDNVNRLPFNLFTLQLFGDKSAQFYGYPYKFKERILTIATEHDWNTTTTKDKIEKDILSSISKDDPVLSVYKNLLTNKLYF